MCVTNAITSSNVCVVTCEGEEEGEEGVRQCERWWRLIVTVSNVGGEAVCALCCHLGKPAYRNSVNRGERTAASERQHLRGDA